MRPFGVRIFGYNLKSVEGWGTAQGSRRQHERKLMAIPIEAAGQVTFVHLFYFFAVFQLRHALQMLF
jgi:hypothetical protein